MKTTAKKPARRRVAKPASGFRPKAGTGNATLAIRRAGEEWAKHWNSSDLENVIAAYASDAVYLPPHHQAIHGREAIREYLRTPLSHNVNDLTFEVTYVKQHGNVAWDVGTYRMMVPQPEGGKKEDHGKYLTVWKRVGERWLIAADAWSSDLPVSH